MGKPSAVVEKADWLGAWSFPEVAISWAKFPRRGAAHDALALQIAVQRLPQPLRRLLAFLALTVALSIPTR